MLYADYNATTPIPKQVVDKMTPFLAEEFGNPSAVGNRLGAKARTAVEEARAQVAQLVGCAPGEVVFLSGGTESCAHAILGNLRAVKKQRCVIYSAVEHSAVVETADFAVDCKLAERLEIAVDREGRLDLNALVRGCKEFPGSLVSVMTANNETGVLFPIAAIASLMRPFGATLHTDAVQAVGKHGLRFADLELDFLSISAHKFGGPKGIGALVIRTGAAWEPVVKGGGQEAGRRGGTEAVAMIVGMGEAAQIRRQLLEQDAGQALGSLRDRFERRMVSELSNVFVTGSQSERLANTSSLRIDGINGQELIDNLAAADVVVSAGSACASSGHKPSRVLSAMGLSAFECLSTVRTSLSFESTAAEVDRLVEVLKTEVTQQRDRIAAELRKLF